MLMIIKTWLEELDSVISLHIKIFSSLLLSYIIYTIVRYTIIQKNRLLKVLEQHTTFMKFYEYKLMIKNIKLYNNNDEVDVHKTNVIVLLLESRLDITIDTLKNILTKKELYRWRSFNKAILKKETEALIQVIIYTADEVFKEKLNVKYGIEIGNELFNFIIHNSKEKDVRNKRITEFYRQINDICFDDYVYTSNDKKILGIFSTFNQLIQRFILETIKLFESYNGQISEICQPIDSYTNKLKKLK